MAYANHPSVSLDTSHVFVFFPPPTADILSFFVSICSDLQHNSARLPVWREQIAFRSGREGSAPALRSNVALLQRRQAELAVLGRVHA